MYVYLFTKAMFKKRRKCHLNIVIITAFSALLIYHKAICICRHVSGQMSLRKRESCHPLGSGNEVMNLPASSQQHKAVQCVWPHTLHQLTLFSHSRCRQNNGAVYSFWSCSRNGGLKCHRILGIKWTLFLNMSKSFANGTWNENFVRWTCLHLLVKL